MLSSVIETNIDLESEILYSGRALKFWLFGKPCHHI